MAGKSANDKTFVRITNKDIYDKLEAWDKKANELIKSNSEEHKIIINLISVTNGKVKWATKIAMSAIGLAVILLGFLFTHINTHP